MISAVPNVPAVEGRSIKPLIIKVVAGGMTAENPVMTHLLVFWTSQPTYPELPDFDISIDPLANALLQ